MRIKMYKSGKNWAMSGLLIAAVAGTMAVSQASEVSANLETTVEQPTTTTTEVTTGLQEKANHEGYTYVQSNGQLLKNDWNGDYYFDNDGNAVKGFVTIQDKLYHFDDDFKVTKSEQSIDHKLYASNDKGVLTAKQGFEPYQNGAFLYYIDGVRANNVFENDQNGYTYYFGLDGVSVNGLQTINGDEFYFENYKLKKSADFELNGVPYHSDQEGHAKAKNGILWGFGDSTTVGWNPYNDGSRSYDYYAAQNLKKLYKNTSAYSGTQIGSDMTWMTDQVCADPSFQNASEIVIALGVNDLNYGMGLNLNTIADIYQNSLRRIHEANPNIKIYILLPQGEFPEGRNNDWIGNDGFSLNQLKDVLTRLGHNLGVTVIDAGVVTNDNHHETMPDGVHPTNDSYKKIGQKITDAINQNPNNNFRANYTNYSLPSQNGYVNTLAGWRWLENGHVYSGFRYYMGTYYWFVKGVRQNEGWREAWGRWYYTDADGRAVQGIRNINGQVFDFGNDGSFYMRSSGYLYDGSSQNGGYRWYEDGKLFTGFRFYMGTYYWFVDGVRQNAGWRQAWGMTYYTDETGRAVQGTHIIDGKVHNFGTDNSYYERPVSGYLYDGSNQNGGYRWYENGQLFTGFRFYMGTFYWFIDGVRQNEGWRHAWGMTYWTNSEGRAVEGIQTIDGKTYNFGNDGGFYLR
ncbi:GDSL-type esterase/lipase family protein [Fructobacillus sp. W13]|uniref:GDSL-type esterase/lipase family protein n=1 Tax=Fructobacillus apis TaxID=2935017 RepID=A0ABT0ZNY3_9LACO|nr:GDSL-type esterase/lipase family protein [Fructobacillus apis]MCO0831696.1 GDSL-type esterase/lipase family protein [Fructobacillus apis]